MSILSDHANPDFCGGIEKLGNACRSLINGGMNNL